MSKTEVQSIDRLFNIIELLAMSKDGLGITEISNEVDLAKSTVHRLLTTLVTRDYMEQVQETSKYRIGPKFVEIANIYLNRLDLRTEANPYLRNLSMRTNSSVHLAILKGNEAMYIEKLEPVTYICMYSQIGKCIPAYCSALGKVLMASLDDKTVRDLLKETYFEKFTHTTIADLETFVNTLNSVREKGFAFDDEEHETGIFCLAFPIRDFRGKVIAALSVSSYSREDIIFNEKTISLVKNTAEAISKRMGYISK